MNTNAAHDDDDDADEIIMHKETQKTVKGVWCKSQGMGWLQSNEKFDSFEYPVYVSCNKNYKIWLVV